MKRHCSWLYCLVAMAIFVLMAPAAHAETSVMSGSTQISVANYGFLPGIQAIVPTAGNQFLSVNLVVKTAADAKETANPAQLLLAVDEKGRAYTPLLYNGTSSFTATMQPGEKAVQVLFEIPDTAASYRLAVLSPSGEGIMGTMDLGKSIGAALSNDDATLATVSAQGYTAVIHSAIQSKSVFLGVAPEGMKYVLLDVTLTGAGTDALVSQLASRWVIADGAQEMAGVIPTRESNLLALMNTRLNDQMPSIRGMLCYLVPEGWAELKGLTVDGTPLASLPISGELKPSGLDTVAADGAYHQAGWKITVHGIRVADKGDLANPPAGSKYVVANLTLDNQSTQNLTVSSELAFAMTDANGNELTQAWFKDLTEPLDAVLLPSESITGEVAFLLPDGAQAGILRVHLNMLGEPLRIDAASYLK